MRVLEHRSNGARGEVVRLWTLLDMNERERMFPAIATAIVETVHATFAMASRAEPEQILAVYWRARWLCDSLSPDPVQAEGPDPDVLARAMLAALVLRAAIVVLLGWSLERTRPGLEGWAGVERRAHLSFFEPAPRGGAVFRPTGPPRQRPAPLS
jgi:hypothetical protein